MLNDRIYNVIHYFYVDTPIIIFGVDVYYPWSGDKSILQ